MFEKNGKTITFRDQLIQQHQVHLRLYKDYINENYQKLGFAKEKADEIVFFVVEYIDRYKEWEKMKKPVCF